MVGYLRQLDVDRNDSILLMAELSYIFFKDGDNTRVIYSTVHNCWFIWRGKWEECSIIPDPVADMFQCELLPACRELNSSARTPQSRLKFADSFVRNLECRSKVRNVVDECKKFFTTERIIFDQDPNIFSFANSIVLDLHQNEFRFARPSDLCRRASLLDIPHRWLVGEAYLADTSAARAEAWSTLWSISGATAHFTQGVKLSC